MDLCQIVFSGLRRKHLFTTACIEKQCTRPLSKNLDQNIIKMRIFGRKAVKSPQGWRLRLQTPLASGGWTLRPYPPFLLLLLSPTAVTFAERVSSD